MLINVLSSAYIFIKMYLWGDFVIRICLDKALGERNISRYELSKRSGIQYQIIDNYYKNKVKRYDGFVLDRICSSLDCKIEDVIEYIK